MKTKSLETNKLNMLELGFLRSLGWKVVNAWHTAGDESVEVNSLYEITDKRYTEGDKSSFIKHYWV